MSIPQNNQINLQPGLRKLAMELEGAVNETRLDELRGMVRVLDGLSSCLHGDYERDEEVLHKELNHLVQDVHEKKGCVKTDLANMMNTMFDMANDNVLAVSRVDCARVFAGALASAEEILQMHKPMKSYLSEAQGIVHCVCQLMHVDSLFPEEHLVMAQKLDRKCDCGTVHLLRSHLERIG